MIYFTSFVMMDQIFLGSVCALCGGNCRGINAQVFTYCNADPDPGSEKSSMWIRIHCHTGHSRGLRWYRYLAYLPVFFRLIYPCFLQCSGSGQNPEPFWSDLVAVAVTSSFCLPICHIESLMIVEILSSCLLKYRTLVCAIFNQSIKCVA